MSLLPQKSCPNIANQGLSVFPRKAFKLTRQLRTRNIFQLNEGIDSWNGHFLLDMRTEGAERLPPPVTLGRNGRAKNQADALASGVQKDQLNSRFPLRLPCLSWSVL